MASQTQVTVPLSAANLEGLRNQVDRASGAGADMLELRVDYLEGVDADQVRAALNLARTGTTCPVIVTCRDPREGGQHQLGATTRQQVLCAAIEAGADYIDLELANVSVPELWEPVRAALQRRPRTQLILSSHDFDKPFEDLLGRYRQTRAACAEAIPKLVYMTQHINDCFPTFDLLHGEGPGAIVLAMGEAGLISRILALKLGAHLTFASLDDDAATAPGQIGLQDFKELYRAHTIDTFTQFFGIVGDPVEHSKSPAIHNACLKRQDMNSRYLPFWVAGQQGEVVTFLGNLNVRPWLGIRGLSVTLPHKREALEFVRDQGGQVEPLVEKIGATNTLIMQDKSGDSLTWAAYNTDYSGAMDAIYKALKIEAGQLTGWPVAVLGAGGVARALVAGLCDGGAEVTIYNRTVAKAQALAEEFSCRCAGLEALADMKARLIVNCTSVGMSPQVEVSPVPEASLAGVAAVFDTIYNPRVTRLLAQARANGAACVDGVDMFINQALIQYRLFTGTEGDAHLMSHVMDQVL